MFEKCFFLVGFTAAADADAEISGNGPKMTEAFLNHNFQKIPLEKKREHKTKTKVGTREEKVGVVAPADDVFVVVVVVDVDVGAVVVEVDSMTSISSLDQGLQGSLTFGGFSTSSSSPESSKSPLPSTTPTSSSSSLPP